MIQRDRSLKGFLAVSLAYSSKRISLFFATLFSSSLKNIGTLEQSPNRLLIRMARLKVTVTFQSLIVGIFLNIYSRAINLVLAKLARDRIEHIGACSFWEYTAW